MNFLLSFFSYNLRYFPTLLSLWHDRPVLFFPASALRSCAQTVDHFVFPLPRLEAVRVPFRFCAISLSVPLF